MSAPLHRAVLISQVGLHQPDIKTGSLVIVIVSASMWVLDRLWRAYKWVYHGINGYCTISPLPQGATRVVLSKTAKCRPGDHVLLWLPGVSLLERHPFSVMSETPLELVIAARNGFTQRLYKAACRNPGGRYRASMEGPYGRMPDVGRFNKVLLIAGGSGATFALSIARDWMMKCNTSDLSQKLHFVWVVKSASECYPCGMDFIIDNVPGHLEWFPEQLRELYTHPRVDVVLHVTGARPAEKGLADGQTIYSEQSPSWSMDANDSSRNLVQDPEKLAGRKPAVPATAPAPGHLHLRDLFQHGRPVIDTLFRQAMADVAPADKLLITGKICLCL